MSATALIGETDRDPLCNELPYDELSTNGSLLLARDIPLPHGWSIDEAIEFPLAKEDHDQALDWIRAEGSYDPDRYLARQAALCWWIYVAAPWTPDTRKGAAWWLMIVGTLGWHGYQVRADRALDILHPEPDSFERWSEAGGYAALLAALEAAFVAPPGAP